MIRTRPHVTALAPYALADVGDGLHSLAQNESAFPPSPKAIAAGQAALVDAALYPDPDWRDLRAALAQVYHVDPDQVLCGNGSMELIWSLIHAYAGPGDQVLSTAHAYALFKTSTAAAGAEYVAAAEPDLTVSVDSILAAVSPATRIVAVANPGNPTGTRIEQTELRRLRTHLPDDVLLLVDQAYAEFSGDSTDRINDPVYGGNTVVLRTLSKAYALAGQRVGWGVFPSDIADQVRKLMNPNNISGVAQAMAVAAVRDQAYMRDIVGRTIEQRDRFATAIRQIKLDPVDSHTNFVLIRFADADQAVRADTALRAKGILMRGMSGYGLPHCLRATIGPADIMDRAVAALSDWRAQEDI